MEHPPSDTSYARPPYRNHANEPALDWREERPEVSAAAADLFERQRVQPTGGHLHPKQRLDWRGMGRDVRGTRRDAQMP